jgi:hypothetical protein
MDKQLFNIRKEKQQNEENMNLIFAVTEEIFSKYQHRIISFWMLFAVIILPFSDTVLLPAIDTIAKD